MNRRRSGRTGDGLIPVNVRITAKPMHSDMPGKEIADLLERERSAAVCEGLSPQQYVARGIMKLSNMRTRTAGVLILSDAINEGLDISDAIPLLEKHLPGMDPITRDITVSVIMFHHFNRQEDAEILSYLRHENPEISSTAADYMAIRAFTGFSISLFTPELIRMVYHKDAGVARSAFNAVSAAAILSADEIAAIYIRSIYSQDSGEC